MTRRGPARPVGGRADPAVDSIEQTVAPHRIDSDQPIINSAAPVYLNLPSPAA